MNHREFDQGLLNVKLSLQHEEQTASSFHSRLEYYLEITWKSAESVKAVGNNLALFPGSRAGEEEREPGTHCSRMRQVPLVTCILLHYTKTTVNSVYLLKSCDAWLYPFETHTGGF